MEIYRKDVYFVTVTPVSFHYCPTTMIYHNLCQLIYSLILVFFSVFHPPIIQTTQISLMDLYATFLVSQICLYPFTHILNYLIWFPIS